MKTLIVGAGGIGCLVAAKFLDAGIDVTLLARGKTLDALNQNGLRVSGHTQFNAPVVATDSPAGKFELVVLATKATATHLLAPELPKYLAEKGRILSLQNGFGNGQKLARYLDASRIEIGLTSNGVTVLEPGFIRHAGVGMMQVGPLEKGGGAQAYNLLESAGFSPEKVQDPRPKIWAKAIVNHGLNTVSSLFDCKNGDLLDHPERMNVVDALVREATLLGLRARVTLPTPEKMVEATRDVIEKTRDNTCSMVQDIRAKRLTEIEQISGRLVRLGELLLATMPRSDTVYGRIKDIEESYLGAIARASAFEELRWSNDPF